METDQAMLLIVTGTLLVAMVIFLIWNKSAKEQAKMQKLHNSQLQGMHFLLAEDNELNSEIMVEILKSEGATCEAVENGQLAVERFTDAPAHTFDAILMDIMMPVMNGYDATRAIRASGHPEALSIPIVAMTANAFVKDVQNAEYFAAERQTRLTGDVIHSMITWMIRQFHLRQWL